MLLPFPLAVVVERALSQTPTHQVRGPEPVVAAGELGCVGDGGGALQTKSGSTRNVFDSALCLQLGGSDLLSLGNGREQNASDIYDRNILSPEGE